MVPAGMEASITMLLRRGIGNTETRKLFTDASSVADFGHRNQPVPQRATLVLCLWMDIKLVVPCECTIEARTSLNRAAGRGVAGNVREIRAGRRFPGPRHENAGAHSEGVLVSRREEWKQIILRR